MKEPRFKIGEWVRAKETILFGSNHDPKVPERIIFKRSGVNGIIVGAATRFLGVIKTHEWEEQACLKVKKSVMVWKIRQGYMNKEYEALDEDVVSLEDSDIILLKNDIPLRYNHEWHSIGGFERREALSLDSRDFPRNKKGQWI